MLCHVIYEENVNKFISMLNVPPFRIEKSGSTFHGNHCDLDSYIIHVDDLNSIFDYQKFLTKPHTYLFTVVITYNSNFSISITYQISQRICDNIIMPQIKKSKFYWSRTQMKKRKFHEALLIYTGILREELMFLTDYLMVNSVVEQ